MTGLASLLGYAPGTLALWFALAAGLLTIAAYARAQRLSPEGADAPTDAYLDAVAGARRLYAAFAISVLLAAAVLMKLLLTHDFRASYVASYSGRDLPWFYLFIPICGEPLHLHCFLKSLKECPPPRAS